jgi:spermidine dehydrogenase
MPNTISRRDFLSGSALIIAGGLTPLAQLRAEPGRYYPPALTGLRGSHPGSFEIAHQVGREGKSFDISGLAVEQSFDLGRGRRRHQRIGGGVVLSRGARPRLAHPDLDNHDDFGGHAKRNEFRVGDRLLIGYGGTESLQSPKALFSKTVNRLLQSLGVEYCALRIRPSTASSTRRSA